MLNDKENKIKKEIIKELGVVKFEDFNVKKAIKERVDYLKSYIIKSNTNGIVLGISGGVDSATAGKLSQIAINELKDEGYNVKFIAMRLPYGIQKDENDAQKSIEFIGADKVVTVNIKEGVDGILNSGLSGLYDSEIDKNGVVTTVDFVKGNIKARMRMISQYQVAGMYNLLVLGTDHNAECTAGFYTKHGDGACDLIVLNGLNKRQVRECAKELGAPEWLYNKEATADLEDENPQVSDEIALGFKYNEMDDFLEGKKVSTEVEKKIIAQYSKTQHKREMPVFFKKT